MSKLQGVVELTSIINMIALEQQHREALGEAPTEAQAGPAPRRAEPGPAMVVPGHPRPRVMPPGPNDLQDPGELMPTLPRQLPSAPQAMPGPPQAMPGPQRPMPGPPQAMPGPPQTMLGPPPMLSAPPPMMPGPPQAMPGPPQTRLGPHLQAPTRRGSQVKKRTFFRPWMVFVAIVLAAAAAGVIVAMSGPHVAVQHGK